MSKTILRDATADDIATLTELSIELGYPDSKEDIYKRFVILESKPEHRIIVAERDSQVIGLMSFFPLDLLFGAGKLGRITALIVTKPKRGMGVGKMLVQKAEELAMETGCHRLELTTNIHRTEAHTFYERLGFEANAKRFIKKI